MAVTCSSMKPGWAMYQIPWYRKTSSKSEIIYTFRDQNNTAHSCSAVGDDRKDLNIHGTCWVELNFKCFNCMFVPFWRRMGLKYHSFFKHSNAKGQRRSSDKMTHKSSSLMHAWNLSQPFTNGSFSWMTPNLDSKRCLELTKHPSIKKTVEFRVPGGR